MLELAILGLLKDQELHGYELKKRLTETFGPMSRVSFGSLYPALRRLERAGAVEVASGAGHVGPSIPTTGSLAGELAAFRARRSAARDTRGRKVYGITPAGEELFERLLATGNESADDDREFNLRLAFARHLAVEDRLGLLERRRAQLVERLARARAAIKAGRERLDSYARSIAEHSTEATERDISWIDRLIEAEKSASASPSAAPDPGPRAGAGAAAGTEELEGIEQ
ncbi:MAG TPA: PadR family transcriptional regulator [Acidimicrobiales bacterium]|nr:PadR family transcriptional regulator [Acidimicrobiales bacterium]